MSDDDIPKPYEYREHALIILPGTNWEEWSGVWSSTDRMQRSSAFWTGDALLYAQAAFPDQWTQVVDPKYIHQQKGPMWVCSRIPPARRRASLSYSLHREVASLAPEVQDRWLDQAEAGAWTVRDLKEALEAEKRAREAYPSNGGPVEDDGDPPSGDDADSTWNEPDDESTFGDPVDIDGEAPPAPPQRAPEGEATEAGAISYSVSAPAQGDAADHIRSLIAQIRRLAPDLPDDWRLEGLKINGEESVVKLTRGAQLAIGQGPSLPCALVEAALSALLSDLGAG